MAEYSLSQLIATPYRDPNTYSRLISAFEHINQNAGDLASLSVGSAPGFGAALDLRQDLAITSADGNAYTATPSPAPDSDSITAGAAYRFVPNMSNDGAVTLNIGSTEGAVSVKRYADDATKKALVDGDLIAGRPVWARFDGTDWVLVSNYSMGRDTAFHGYVGGTGQSIASDVFVKAALNSVVLLPVIGVFNNVTTYRYNAGHKGVISISAAAAIGSLPTGKAVTINIRKNGLEILGGQASAWSTGAGRTTARTELKISTEKSDYFELWIKQNHTAALTAKEVMTRMSGFIL